MSDELQKPPVVDLEVLLQAIPGENPSGENLRYSGLYDEISEARRADDDLAQGDWKTELKVADYRRVVDLAVAALSSQTKDLQVAVWLTEALIKQYGFAGFRDGLKLIAGLHQNFWDTMHPEIEDGDMEGRANAVAWLDSQVSFAVKKAPYTGSAGYGFLDWEDSKVFDIPENIDTLPTPEQARVLELKTVAERDRRVTAEMWQKEKAATRRASVEEANATLEACWAAFDSLNKVIEERYERNQMPSVGNLKKAIDDVHTQVKKLLEEKRIEEPDPADEMEAGEVSENGTGGAPGTAAAAGTSGAIQNRRDALKRLGEIAAYFQKTEPHSPVSYLVNRAVKWGNMPLENWLQDVIKDEAILFQLRQTLGFNTSSNDNPGQEGQ